MKGFWRIDKLKDHMERKHPEIEIERWYYAWTNRGGGYRDVEKSAQHKIWMRSKRYKPSDWDSIYFLSMSAAEEAAIGLISPSPQHYLA